MPVTYFCAAIRYIKRKEAIINTENYFKNWTTDDFFFSHIVLSEKVWSTAIFFSSHFRLLFLKCRIL